jgi:Predicted pPIWI-associating nuclease
VLENDPWEDLRKQVDDLIKDIRAVSAVAINSVSLKGRVKQAVQTYFRSSRPLILNSGILESRVVPLDAIFHDLNQLALGNNRKTSYVEKLKVCRSQMSALAIERDIAVGERKISKSIPMSPQQQKIVETLRAMLPGAATSFSQAIIDLGDSSRISYRGTAAELREVLREVIDHLAPDDAVSSAPGFQLEKGREFPTMRQKMRFIMKNRRGGTAAGATAEDALAGADALVRSLYNRGSAATHSTREKAEVAKIRTYTEAILVDVLEID